MNNRILVIDDQENILEDFRTILTGSEGTGAGDLTQAAMAARCLGFEIEQEVEEVYQISTALQGQEGLDLVHRAVSRGEPFAVAFIDLRMPPGWDGIRTAAEIRKIDKDIEIVIVTAYSDRDRREIVKAVGGSEKLIYLKKPFDVEEIRQLALCLTQKWMLHRKERSHRERLEKLLLKITAIKTHTGDSRKLLEMILEDVVGEIRAEKGLVISWRDGKPGIEAQCGQFAAREVDGVLQFFSGIEGDTRDIVRTEAYTILPFKTDEKEAIVVFGKYLGEEERPFLDLFLSSASELVKNARLFERSLRNEKMASIGLATRTILHDLKNPLMHISASLEFCAVHPRLPGDLNKWIRAARDGARRINEMVTDISDFTLGSIQLQVAPVVLSSFIKEVIALWNDQLDKSRVELFCDVGEDVSVPIDRKRFHRVLDNLIINAVEAMEKSPRRRLSITGRVQGDRVVLKVGDTGPGIPEGIRSKIFDPFQSFGKRGGSGLGLAIVRQFVELHGGRMTLETEPSGTTFVIDLPRVVA